MQLAKRLSERLENTPFVDELLQSDRHHKGSNAWVVSGDHTASGSPLIANDPHLPSGIPALMHESRLIFNKDGAEWTQSGLTIPGGPGVILGCNTASCWGVTVANLDVSDILTEAFQTNAIGLPTHSLHDGNPEPLQQVFNSWFVNVIGDEIPDNLVRANSIGYTSGAITLIVPRHNDAPVLDIDGTTGLALAFTGSRDTHEMTWIHKMGLAGGIDEFKESLQYADVGALNIFYADVEGNIAYFQTGEKPLREDLANFTIEGTPPWVIRDGTGTYANEWLPVANPQPHQALDFEMMPFDEMPHEVNPATGYLANANSDTVGATLDNVPYNQVRPSGNGLYYLSPYYWSYRMGRIDRELASMVSSGTPLTVNDMQALQANVQMLDAELVLPVLLQIMAQVPVPPGSPMEQAIDVLSTWDYTANTGLAEGWDAGDDPIMTTEPTADEVRSAAAASVWAMWRSMLVQNTIYATLNAYGMGSALPTDRRAYRAFKHHLFNYETAGGVGASGINFFSQGLAETVAGSLQMALERLASDEFAPAFGNSTNVLDYAWGKLHRIKFRHTLDQDPLNVPNGGNLMDLAPDMPGLARQGGFGTVDLGYHPTTADSLNGPNSFMFTRTAILRLAADLEPGAIHAEQVYPGGQSGVFYHPNFADQMPLWLTNSYRPMPVSAADSDAVAVRSYSFGPVTPAPAADSAEENTND
jgi:penicillin amidase